MILMVRQQKGFVCPDTAAGKEKSAEAFSKAAEGLKVPVKKKQAQAQVPRGGSKGKTRLY